MAEQRVRSGVAGRRERGRRAGSTGSTSYPHTRRVAPVFNRVTDRRRAPLVARVSQGRRRGQSSGGTVAGGADPLRVLSVRRWQWRASVDVRRSPLGGHGGRGVDRRRLGPSKDAGYAEGRVLRVTGGPERRLAHVEAKGMVIVQSAAGLAVFLLQKQLGRRRAAPRTFQFQILLGHHGHLDLRFTGHACLASKVAVPATFADHRRMERDSLEFGSPWNGTRLRWQTVTRSTEHGWLRDAFVPSEERGTLLVARRRSDGRARSIRHAERFESRLASHIKRRAIHAGNGKLRHGVG